MSPDAIATKFATVLTAPTKANQASSGARNSNPDAASFESYLAIKRNAAATVPKRQDMSSGDGEAPKETDKENDSVALVAPVTAESAATTEVRDTASEQPDQAAPLAPFDQSAAALAAQSGTPTEIAQNVVSDLLAAQNSALPDLRIGGPDTGRAMTGNFASLSLDRRNPKDEIDSTLRSISIDSAAIDSTLQGYSAASIHSGSEFTRTTQQARLSRARELSEPTTALSSSEDQIEGTPFTPQLDSTVKTATSDFSSLLGTAIGAAQAPRASHESSTFTASGAGPAYQNYEISVPLDSPQFGGSLANHLSSIVSQSAERAEIQLNPRELGPIRVEISIKDRETHVLLIAAEPRTVAAIEQSSSMLRSLLAEQGLSLAQLDIRAGSAGSDRTANPQNGQAGGGQSGSEQNARNNGQAHGESSAPSEAMAGLPIQQHRAQRLLDLFA
jgi:flagellar hook-length control protein FliK